MKAGSKVDKNIIDSVAKQSLKTNNQQIASVVPPSQ